MLSPLHINMGSNTTPLQRLCWRARSVPSPASICRLPSQHSGLPLTSASAGGRQRRDCGMFQEKPHGRGRWSQGVQYTSPASPHPPGRKLQHARQSSMLTDASDSVEMTASCCLCRLSVLSRTCYCRSSLTIACLLEPVWHL